MHQIQHELEMEASVSKAIMGWPTGEHKAVWLCSPAWLAASTKENLRSKSPLATQLGCSQIPAGAQVQDGEPGWNQRRNGEKNQSGEGLGQNKQRLQG